MTKFEILQAAEELANIYHLTDTNPRAINRDRKHELYELSGRYPKIHRLALRINNTRNRGG